MAVLKDHIKEGLDILFIGFNPSIRSGETGHHYANPNNRFWRILQQSGLTKRKYKANEDGELLEIGYGLTNIVSRPTKAATEITKDEYQKGKAELRRKITRYKPRIACYVGKGVYLQFSGKQEAPWGLQDIEVVEGTVDFVAPSSSGLVRMKMDEIVKIYAALNRLKNELKAG